MKRKNNRIKRIIAWILLVVTGINCMGQNIQPAVYRVKATTYEEISTETMDEETVADENYATETTETTISGDEADAESKTATNSDAVDSSSKTEDDNATINNDITKDCEASESNNATNDNEEEENIDDVRNNETVEDNDAARSNEVSENRNSIVNDENTRMQDAFQTDGTYETMTVSQSTTLTADMEVGDLTINAPLYLNGYKLTVYGDVTLNSQLYIEEGYLLVQGDFQDSIYAGWYMESLNDYVMIQGDYIYNNYYYSINKRTKGIVEIKGDIIGNTSNYCNSIVVFAEQCKVILSGDEMQTIDIRTDSRLVAEHLVIENISDEGVYATHMLMSNIIEDENEKLFFDCEGERGTTLTEDVVIEGDYLLLSGTLDLAGYNMSITGDLIHAGGIIDINGGSLTVEGDYERQFCYMSGSTKVTDYSTGRIIMDESEDYVLIKGNYVDIGLRDTSEDMTAGTLELQGSILVDDNLMHTPMQTTEGHIFKMTGGTKQVIEIGTTYQKNKFSFSNMIIEQPDTGSAEWTDTIEVTGSVAHYSSNVNGITLLEDAAINSENLYGNIESKSSYTFNSNVTIYGNLTVGIGKGYSNRIMTVQDSHVTVKGNFYHQYIGVSMTGNNAVLTVEGDYILSDGTATKLSSGIFEFGGNITNSGIGYLSFGEATETRFIGTEVQNITISNKNSLFTNVVVDNPAGVVVSDDIAVVNVSCKQGLLSYTSGGVHGFTLEEDSVYEGDLTIGGGILNLNGHSYHVTGNLTIAGGALNMTQENDSLTVDGDFVTSSTVDHSKKLTAGTLEVKGDFTQSGNSFSFVGTDKHKTVFTGSEQQTITFAEYTSSYFNDVTFDNTTGITLVNKVPVNGYVTQNDTTMEGWLGIKSNAFFDNRTYNGDVFFIDSYNVTDVLEIGGDVQLASNKALTVNAGSLSVEGDITLGWENRIVLKSANLICNSLVETTTNSYLLMYGSETFVTIMDAIVLTSAYNLFSEGHIAVGGDISLTGNFFEKFDEGVTLELNGTKKQNITMDGYYHSFGKVILNNSSEEGIFVEKDFNCTEIDNTANTKVTFANGGIMGYVLQEDEVIDGDLLLAGGCLDLNGHTLTVKGDMLQNCGILSLNGGKLLVEGNYALADWTIDDNGEYSYSDTSAYIQMIQEQESITVKGNLYNYATLTLSGGVLNLEQDWMNYGSINGSNTKIYLKGNLEVLRSVRSNLREGCELHFIGEQQQNCSQYIEYMDLGTMVINNPDGITVSNYINVYGKLITNDNPVDGWIYLYGTVGEDIVHANVNFAAEGSLTKDIRIEGEVILGKLLLNGQHLTVAGDCTLNYVYRNDIVQENGILEVKGNLIHASGYGYTGIGTNKVILSGDEKQTLCANNYSWVFHEIEVANTSHEGVYSEEFLNASIITDPDKKLSFSVEGEVGYTLTSDTVISGDLNLLGGTMDLNGHKLTVLGDVVQRGGNIDVNQGEMHINGDYILGNLSESGSFMTNNAILTMDEESDYVYVKGNVVLSSGTNFSSYLSAGKLEIKGDFTYQSNLFTVQALDSSFHIVMSGKEKQTIYNLANNNIFQFGTLELQNTSAEGVVVANNLYITKSVIGSDKLHGTAGQTLYWYNGENPTFAIWEGNLTISKAVSLVNDIKIEGTLTITADLDVNGYHMIVDSIRLGRKLTINGGIVQVKNDVVFSAYTAGIIMDTEEDVLQITGNLTTGSGILELLAGQLEVKGNMSLNNVIVTTGDTHTTMLSGKRTIRGTANIQEITVAEGITLNKLVLTKPREYYSFNRAVEDMCAELVDNIQDVTPPTVPEGVTVSDISYSKVTISWQESTDDIGVAGYDVYRDDQKIISVAGNSYVDKNLTPGTEYSYYVIAKDSILNTSAASETVTATTLEDDIAPDVPEQPELIQRTGTTLKFTWNPAADNAKTTGYRIYCNGEEIATTKRTEYLDKDLSTNQYYMYQITAFDEKGNESALSEEISFHTQAVEIAEVTPAEYTELSGSNPVICISFANAGSTEGYQVYIGYQENDETEYTQIFSKTVGKGTAYKKIITAQGTLDSASIQSEEIEVLVRITDAGGYTVEERYTYYIDKTAPAKLSEVGGEVKDGVAVISYAKGVELDVAGYYIYRQTDEKEKELLVDITEANKTFYYDKSMKAGITYTYYVTAYDEEGYEGEPSEPVVLTCDDDSSLPIINSVEPIDGILYGVTDIVIQATDNKSLDKAVIEAYEPETEEYRLLGEAVFINNRATYALDTTAFEKEVSIRITVFDTAGNENETEYLKTYEIDNAGPNKINNFEADITSTTVILSWDAPSDDDFSHFVLEELLEDGTWKEIGRTTTVTGYVLEGLVPQSSHTYRVTGYDIRNNAGMPSEELTITVGEDTIAPRITSVTPNGGYYSESIPLIVKAYDNVGLQTVVVEYSIDQETWNEITTVTLDEIKKEYVIYYDFPLQEIADGNVYIRAYATDTAGITGDVGQVLIQYIVDHNAPAQVTTLIAEGVAGSIHLTWNEPVDNDIKEYKIYRSVEGIHSYRCIAEKVTTLGYYDRTAAYNVSYSYQILAVDQAGNESVLSNVAVAQKLNDDEAPVIYSLLPEADSWIAGEQELSAYIADNDTIASVEFAIREEAEDAQKVVVDTVLTDISSGTVTCQFDSTVYENGTYQLQVAAKDATGNVSETFTSTCNIYNVTLATPKLYAIAGNWCAELFYTGMKGESFVLYKKKLGDDNFEVLTTGTESLIYKDNNVHPNYTYVYQLMIQDKAGNTAKSVLSYIKPNAVDDRKPKASILADTSVVEGYEIAFNGLESTDNDRIASYVWDFGDGSSTVEGPTPIHFYRKAGVYYVTLTVTDPTGNTGNTSIKVTVLEKSVAGKAIIEVRNAAGSPLKGVTVFVNTSSEHNDMTYTDQYGVATIMQKPGTYRVALYKPGYVATEVSVDIELHGETNYVFTLQEGETMTADFNVRQLTFDEIVAAGIDLSDPTNQHVFTVETKLTFVEASRPVVQAPRELKPVKAIIGPGSSIGLSGGGEGSNYDGGGSTNPSEPKEEDEEIEDLYYTIYITQSISWLKDMYEATLVVYNNANSPTIVAQDLTTSLVLPSGISMAGTGKQQSMSQTLPDIRGGESQSVSWYLRGDVAGTYKLNALLSGKLQPFNADISCNFESNEFEVTAGEGLVLTINPENRAEKGESYYVYFTLSNEGSKEFYNVKTTFGTSKNNSKRYITETGGSKRLPVIATGDEVVVNCLKPGESISGIYKTSVLVEGEKYVNYMKLIDYECSVISGANLGVQVRISPVASHVAVPDIIYVENTDENSEADPVNVSTGAYTDAISALSVQGVNPISAGLTYDSTAVDALGGFGYGWTHNYEAFLKDMNDGTIRYYVSPSGYYTFLAEDYEKMEYSVDENGYYYLDASTIPIEQTYKCLSTTKADYSLSRDKEGLYTLKDVAGTTMKFDKTGSLMLIKNKDGKKVEITRGKDEFVVTDAVSGRSLTYTLNDDKMVSKVSDKNEREAFFYYDENQCLKQFTNALGESTYYTYDDKHRILTVTDDNGNIYVTNEYREYDSPIITDKKIGRVVRQKDGLGNETKFSYTLDNQSGDMTTIVTTRSGKTKKTVTDAYGNVTQMVSEAGDATDMTYDTDGNETSVNNANGYSVLYRYDSNGNMTAIENSLMDGTKAETVMTYDGDGNMLSMQNCNGESMSCTYYNNGLIKTVTDQNKNTITYTYNANGQIESQTDANDRKIEYTYNDQGDLVSVKDKNGNITSYTYNALGLQETTIIQDGEQKYSTTTYYDDMGRVDYTIDTEGGITSYEYDCAGNITSRTDPGGAVTVYSYDDNYQLIKETVYPSEAEEAKATSTTDYTYTKEGLLKTVTDGTSGTVITNTYDAVGNIIIEVEADKDGNTLSEMHYEYDKSGNVTKQTAVCLDEGAVDADNVTTQYQYYPNGELNYSIDTAGKKTVYTYDKSWRIQSIVSETEPTITYTYDAAGRVLSETTGGASDELMTVSYTYDIYGNVLTVTDPKKNVTEYKYDNNGNLTETIDTTKRVFYNKYDALNRIVETGMRSPLEPKKDIVLGTISYNMTNHTITETDAVNGGSITTYYDSAGRPVKTTDEKGAELSETIYDTEGRILQTVDAKGMVTENVYNEFMQIETIRTGAKGNKKADGTYILISDMVENGHEYKVRETKYQYDGLGRTTQVTDAEDGVSSVVFDSLGRIVSMKDPNQNAENKENPVNTYTYEYNKLGLLAKETNAIGNVTEYRYNDELLLESIKDSANEKTSYEYDSLNRLTKVSDKLGTITYTYDENGNIKYVKEKESGLLSVEKTIYREYDSLNRVTLYTDYNGREVRYGYDNLGNMITLTYPGGEIVRYEYYADGQVKTMTSNSGGTTYTWSYTYDRYGRLKTLTRPNGTKETRTYDNAGNLLSQEEKQGQKILWKNNYTYNVFGEMIKKTTVNAGDASQIETIKMTYNDFNRLVTYNGQEVTYDEKGNMTYGPVDGKMQELTYDCRNRLVEAGGVSYTYDAENIRITSTENGRTTEYVTDTSGSLSRLLTAYEADGTETKYYYGAEGLAGECNTGSKKWLFYHFDNIGSTTCVTDIAGAIVETFTYGTYGELLSTVQNGIRFLYNGAYGVVTDNNGLYYMRARYYNPDIKRFINQDIKVGDIGNSQSLNRYAYCEGNPISLIDPFGLSPEASQDQAKESKFKWVHTTLDAVGLFWDGADIVNAFVYAAEGKWILAGISVACALPFIGTFVTGITKASKFAKVGNIIGKTLKVTGKTYMTAEVAKTALDLAGDAKIERAINGGQSTSGSVLKELVAIVMGGIAFLSGRSLIADIKGLSKAVNIDFKTKNQQNAELNSGMRNSSSGVGCFVAGTQIMTAEGDRDIEDVEVGDYVLAEDVETGTQEYKKVVRTYIHEKDILVHVYVENEEIETTVEHPFYVERIGWVSAGELKAGDIIRTADGRNLPIQKVEIEELDEPIYVYNFEVEDHHTYYVSELGVLVHNMCARTNSIESGTPSTTDRIRNVAQQSFDYAVNNPRKQGLNRMQLGKDAEIQATRWTRKWAERNGIDLSESGLHFQVRGEHSIPDVVYEPTKNIMDFKLTPKAVRKKQSDNFKSDFPGYSIEYIFGPGPWRE